MCWLPVSLDLETVRWQLIVLWVGTETIYWPYQWLSSPVMLVSCISASGLHFGSTLLVKSEKYVCACASDQKLSNLPSPLVRIILKLAHSRPPSPGCRLHQIWTPPFLLMNWTFLSILNKYFPLTTPQNKTKKLNKTKKTEDWGKWFVSAGWS